MKLGRKRGIPAKQEAIVDEAQPAAEVTVLSSDPKAKAEAEESLAKWEERHQAYKGKLSSKNPAKFSKRS